MAFEINAPQPKFFEGLSAIGQSLKQNQLESNRQAAFADAQNGIPLSQIASRLGQIGDIEGATTFARLAEAQAQHAATLDLAQKTLALHQYQASPEYLEKVARMKAGIEAEYAPKTTNITTPAGDTFTVEKGPHGYQLPKVEGLDTAAGAPNPYAMPGKQPTEAQQKDITYATRIGKAEGVLANPAYIEAGNSLFQQSVAKIPIAGNYINSKEYQTYDQSARDFINAVLRRESGAAISASEFDNAYKQYLPRPGDSPEALAAKQENRRDAYRAISAGAGRNFQPPITFGPNGEIIPNPKAGPPRVPAKSEPANPAAVTSAPNEAQIAFLKKNYRMPGIVEKFDEKFGVGQAARILGVK